MKNKEKIKYSKLIGSERRVVREECIISQKGKCLYCKENLIGVPPKRITDKPIDWKLFPANFLRYPVHLQHNHITDDVEGAVHAYCNAVMWQYEGK